MQGMEATRVEWGKRADFAEAAEALAVPTDCIMAVVVPPGQTERYCLFSRPDAPRTIYRVRLARDGYDVLRQSSEAVEMPGLWENIEAALDDHFG